MIDQSRASRYHIGMGETELLYDLWYVAAHASELARGKTRKIALLGQNLLLGRGSDGTAFALRDFCPHRGIPLSYGRFDGVTLECCYHGWCFDTGGRCTKIPSLTPDDNVDITRIRAGSFPCSERDGLVWVYMPAPKTRVPETLPPVPAAPIDMPQGYWPVDSLTFPCPIDHAVIGLMDPSHGPFVHASWWWRSRRSMHLKEKKFAPVGMGFRMLGHKPSSNSRAYKILFGGAQTQTEITFQLPGLRTEHITLGKHHIVLLTALTPIDERSTQLHQYLYTTQPLLNAVKGLLKPFGRAFIRQDLDIVKKQQEGLAPGHPGLLLLGDADAQALWYHKLKRDWLAAQASGAPFENRLPEKTLRWRS